MDASQVFLDVTDIIDYNVRLLNHSDITHSFFCLRRDDPTNGFAFDASKLAGHAYAPASDGSTSSDASTDSLLMRLILGSHFAYHMRMQLEERIGYTATVGISTSKLLSKLVGNVNKPRGQTTLLPPYLSEPDGKPSNVEIFMDAHDVGKVPDIGFKMSHKLRGYALKRLGKGDAEPMQVEYDYTSLPTKVTVGELRSLPGLDGRILEDVLAGPGMQKGVGFRTWCLLHGIDDTDVAQAKDTPKQISIEDSFIRMDTMDGVNQELLRLTSSLLRRMRADLTEEISESSESDTDVRELQGRRWLVHPKTLRLSTRPRPPPGADGTRSRASARISRSSDLPTFVFSFIEDVDVLAPRLVRERVLGLFRQLHPDKSWFDLSLINVAVTNMVETAGTSKTSTGRDIGRMFKTQEKSLQAWKVEDVDVPPSDPANDAIDYVSKTEPIGDNPRDYDTDTVMDHVDNLEEHHGHDISNEAKEATDALSIPRLISEGSEDAIPLSQSSQDTGWLESDDDDTPSAMTCPLCGSAMPDFAISAHLRYHEAND